MKLFVLLKLLMMLFASDKNDFVENYTKCLERMGTSNYIGTIYKESCSKWEAHRWSKNEKKLVYSGYYNDEETAAHASDTLVRKLIANGERGHKLNFPDENTEVFTEKDNYSMKIGVSYQKKSKLWVALRWGKKEKKMIYNGGYDDEETAARASDTLARDLMVNGEQNHKLNFPDDHTEVYARANTKYIGVFFHENNLTWSTSRRSKSEKKMVYNGTYKDEETAAHASDTLARKLTEDGEKGHKLNFPDDSTQVYREEKRANYIGVYYIEKSAMWCARRWSKEENKMVYNGCYKYKRRTARASDTLARKLMANGEKGHKLNFPDDDTEVHANEKITSSKLIGVYHIDKSKKWIAQRWSKTEKKMINNGSHIDEETAAHASDTLARELMSNGEEGHKFNFPDDDSDVYPKKAMYQKKRKRQNNSGNFLDKEPYQSEIY